MLIFVSIVHVLLCVFMIFVILLQPGKDAGMGAALGGGAATSAFGGRGAVTFLGKLTAFCAVGFFITALGLSFVGLKSTVMGGAGAGGAAGAVDGGVVLATAVDGGVAPPAETLQQAAPNTPIAPDPGAGKDAVPANKTAPSPPPGLPIPPATGGTADAPKPEGAPK